MLPAGGSPAAPPGSLDREAVPGLPTLRRRQADAARLGHKWFLAIPQYVVVLWGHVAVNVTGDYPRRPVGGTRGTPTSTRRSASPHHRITA
jgi:hypothetical protein